MLRSLRFYICLLVFILLASLSAGSQNPENQELIDAASDKPLKWDLKLSAGYALGNPTVKDFTGDGSWPYSSVYSFHNNIPWGIEVKRSLTKYLSSGISVNRRGFEGIFFTQKQKISSTGFSPILYYNLNDLFIVGGGPSVYFVRHKDFNPHSVLVYKMSKIGFELTSSFRFPYKGRLYCQLDANYCFAGKINKFEFSNVNARPSDDVLLYYARDVKMSYIYLGIGFGFRLI